MDIGGGPVFQPASPEVSTCVPATTAALVLSPVGSSSIQAAYSWASAEALPSSVTVSLQKTSAGVTVSAAAGFLGVNLNRSSW